MNEKQLLKALKIAIDVSDEVDAQGSLPAGCEDYCARKFGRLSSFLISLRVALGADCPKAADLLGEFRMRVTEGKNPLLDAADSNKEKPE